MKQTSLYIYLFIWIYIYFFYISMPIYLSICLYIYICTYISVDISTYISIPISISLSISISISIYAYQVSWLLKRNCKTTNWTTHCQQNYFCLFFFCLSWICFWGKPPSGRHSQITVCIPPLCLQPAICSDSLCCAGRSRQHYRYFSNPQDCFMMRSPIYCWLTSFSPKG